MKHMEKGLFDFLGEKKGLLAAGWAVDIYPVGYSIEQNNNFVQFSLSYHDKNISYFILYTIILHIPGYMQ